MVKTGSPAHLPASFSFCDLEETWMPVRHRTGKKMMEAPRTTALQGKVKTKKKKKKDKNKNRNKKFC